ncbi:type II toxin-antitoxin system HicB family antitoxin [Burkholderia ambifaria]|uniref:type II toxin-antitoxin system HicB family antitoxin n=1 Tax=Burkholderia ambifaria TaxID=152480 RepID=UPI00158C9FDE|nr:type II toxin-antitoxin system HicB family antitoxin [Burkholderia ambifaria]
MNNPDRYPVEVFWSDEDEGFIAIAPDLPGCSAFGEDETTALAELKHAISAWKQAAQSAGNPVPPPSRRDESEFSGKFVLRVPKSVHRGLATSASREGVSLNQYVVSLILSAQTLQAVEAKIADIHVTQQAMSAHQGRGYLSQGAVRTTRTAINTGVKVVGLDTWSHQLVGISPAVFAGHR